MQVWFCWSRNACESSEDNLADGCLRHNLPTVDSARFSAVALLLIREVRNNKNRPLNDQMYRPYNVMDLQNVSRYPSLSSITRHPDAVEWHKSPLARLYSFWQEFILHLTAQLLNSVFSRSMLGKDPTAIS